MIAAWRASSVYVIRPVARCTVMNDCARAQREADLVAYYDNEVRDRAERDLPTPRIARRTAYLDQLEREGLRSVLEIGTGPGRDGQAFAAAGVAYTGVDLAPESVRACRSLGLEAHVASVLDLPSTMPPLRRAGR